MKQRINPVPVIAGRIVRVNRDCTVIAGLRLDIADNARQLIGNILQIRVARQKCLGTPGQKFKLGVCRVTAINGGIGITLDRVLTPAVPMGKIFLIRPKLSEHTQIRKGFIHHHNNVW